MTEGHSLVVYTASHISSRWHHEV